MELNSNSTYTGNIALASLSDYIFASNDDFPETCSSITLGELDSCSCFSFQNNYYLYDMFEMHYKNNYYSLSPFNENKDSWYYFTRGRIQNIEDDGTIATLVPTVYLNPNVKILNDGGDGSFEKPFQLTL